MNTDGHHSGKAHSTHDITGFPTTHGSYAHSHSRKYTARVYTVAATDNTTRVYNKLQSQKYNTIQGR